MSKTIEFDNKEVKALCELTNEQRSCVFNALFDDDYYVEYYKKDNGSWEPENPSHLVYFFTSVAYRVKKDLSEEEKVIKNFVNDHPNEAKAIVDALEVALLFYGGGPGLCEVMQRACNIKSGDNIHFLRPFFESCFKLWPKFSGNLEYPVPHPDGRHPRGAYMHRMKYEGKYGVDRKNLTRFIIRKIKKYLGD